MKYGSFYKIRDVNIEGYSEIWMCYKMISFLCLMLRNSYMKLYLQSLGGVCLYRVERDCLFKKIYKENDFLFKKLKKLFVNYYWKLFIVYANEGLAFWKVKVVTSCFNYLCR